MYESEQELAERWVHMDWDDFLALYMGWEGYVEELQAEISELRAEIAQLRGGEP